MTADAPTTVGHVHLKVRDVDRAVEFYTGVLGLDVTEQYDRFAFLSWGEHHHDVALQEIGADAEGPGPGVGLYHAAFEVEERAVLGTVYDRLIAENVRVSPVDHGISQAIYFDDPDGNGLEVYYDTRDERDIEQWGGRNEPFHPEDL